MSWWVCAPIVLDSMTSPSMPLSRSGVAALTRRWQASRSSTSSLTRTRPLRDQHQVVRDPLQLGQHVRGQHDRDSVVGHRGQHGGHEVVARDRIERSGRFIEHEQAGMPSQRQRQRELCLLPTGQLARLLLVVDAEFAQAAAGVGGVEAQVEIAGQVQHVSDGQVPVQRHVLGDERDPVQSGDRSRRRATENPD